MGNKNWPDKIRLEMIEKSKFYPDDQQIYQYGFYDGYKVGIEQCHKKDEKLVYYKELVDFIFEPFTLTEFEATNKVRELRQKIESLENE